MKSGLLVGALAAFAFLSFPGNLELTGPHEARVAATASEMVRGGDFIVPHLNGSPRLQKPPLAYWAAAVSWLIGGRVDLGLARLPAALCGFAATFLVMDIGRRILGRCGGLLCGLVWTSNLFVLGEFRKCMADPYLAFFSLLAVWAWMVGQDASRCGDGSTPPASRRLSPLLCWAALGLGALAKGPVALLHVGIGISTYQAATRRPPRWNASHLLGALFFAAIVLPWPALVVAGEPGALALWIRESFGQVVSRAHERPWWYYLPQIPLVALPWTLTLLPLSGAPLRGARVEARCWLWPASWLLSGVCLFSLSAMKKSAYLLPLMPAFTLLVAAFLLALLRRASKGPRMASAGRHLRAHLGLGALSAPCFIACGSWLAWRSGAGIPLLTAALFLPSLALSLHGALAARAATRRRVRALLLSAVLFAVAAQWKLSWLDPLRKNPESTSAFARAVLAQVGNEPLRAIGGVKEELLFYLGRPVEILETSASDFSGHAIVHRRDLPAIAGQVKVVVADPASVRREEDRLLLVIAGSRP